RPGGAHALLAGAAGSAAARISLVRLSVAVVVPVVARLGHAGMHAGPGVVAVPARLPRPRLAARAGHVAVAVPVRAERRAVGVRGVHVAIAVLVQAARADLRRGSHVAHARHGACLAGLGPGGAHALLAGAAGST